MSKPPKILNILARANGIYNRLNRPKICTIVGPTQSEQIENAVAAGADKLTERLVGKLKIHARKTAPNKGRLGAKPKTSKWGDAMLKFDKLVRAGMTHAEADAELLKTILKGKGIKPGTAKRRYARYLKERHKKKT